MEAFENSELSVFAERIVCLNYFALMAALWGKVGFDLPISYLTAKPYFFVYASNIWGVAKILFKKPLSGLFAFLIERVAYNFVARTASISQYQPRALFAVHWIAGLWHNRKMDTNSPPVAFGYNGSVFLRRESRETLVFKGSI